VLLYALLNYIPTGWYGLRCGSNITGHDPKLSSIICPRNQKTTVCLGYKSTTDALPYAGTGPGASASFFLATYRKRERWTPEGLCMLGMDWGPGATCCFGNYLA
jgi:hypothetical protein